MAVLGEVEEAKGKEFMFHFMRTKEAFAPLLTQGTQIWICATVFQASVSLS